MADRAGSAAGADPAARLAAEGLDASRWANGPGDRYPAHEHGYDKVIVVEGGSITFMLADGSAIAVASGDRLELPRGTVHAAVVGAAGVTCLEAHLPAGSLAVVRRQAAGEW
jgi:quercetin dioxygenase-like cupin family protein